MAVTMQQIARYLGISRPTVSDILNGKGHLYADATRQKVLRAAAELGYRPNAAARAIVKGRFDTIALLCPQSGSIPQGLLQAISRELTVRRQRLSFASLPPQAFLPGDASALPLELRELAADGLLVHYLRPLPYEVYSQICSAALPAVWINVKLETDCVYPDDVADAHLATTHLIALGHRSIGFIQIGINDTSSVQDRITGYRQALSSIGVAERILQSRHAHGPVSSEEAATVSLTKIREFLSQADRPTAVVSYNERNCRLILTAALQLGLRIPDDLSVVTFAESPMLDMGIPVTTLVQNQKRMGEVALDMLFRKIEDPQLVLKPQILSGTLYPGKTCVLPP